MKVEHITLLGQQHPLCLSLSAYQEICGDLEAADEMTTADTLSMAGTLVDVMVKAGRVYVGAMGQELPPELPCRASDLIGMDDIAAINQVFYALRADTRREVEVEVKNGVPTQGE